MLFLRSLTYTLALWSSTLFFALLTPLLFPLPHRARLRVLLDYARFNVFALQALCGVRFRLEGLENLPKGPAIVLAKHQSTWETFAFQTFLPPHSWVLKRELLWIPFFGWGLAMLRPIAIDRSAGRQALKKLLEGGRARLAQGQTVLIFPEGTRVAPGTKGTYHQGGAFLACKTGTPVIPIAHNAGDYWPRNGFIKHPGTVRVVIGPAIDPTGKKPGQLTEEVEAWIEGRMAEIAAAREG